MSSQLEKTVATAFYGRFRHLTEIQEAAVAPLLSGRNVVLTSGTGSGKTEAVMAPLVSRYWREAVRDNFIFLLYIAPTKALVNDLEKRLGPPLAVLNLRVGVRHGDRDDLKSGEVPHVLITTPESLDVMLFRKDSGLHSLRAVVIDEVHLLYNTQRGLQLSILLQRLQKVLARSIQWAALSATVGNLSYIRSFLMGAGADADLLAFSATRTIDAKIRHITEPKDFLSLVQILTTGRATKLLVFADSRRECERLASILQDDEDLRRSVLTHYSSLSVEVRLDVERKFAAMRTAICIATSTLELGIDIGDIDAVLLWGVPPGVDSFLQRIGRGNRRSNKTNVVCMVTDRSESVVNDGLKFAVLLDSASNGELPIHNPYDLFGAVGQQCLSVIASDEGRFTRVSDLYDLVKHEHYLKREDIESILAKLASDGFLQRHGYKNRYGGNEKMYQLVDLRMIYGNFGAGTQMIDLFHGAKHLGEVPAMNLLRVRRHSVVRFASKYWLVQKVSLDGIHLVPSRGATDAIDFSYGGSRAPCDPYYMDRVWELIHSNSTDSDLFGKTLREQIDHYRATVRSVCSYDDLLYTETTEGIFYYTFAGSMVNRAVGLFSRKQEFKADDISLFVLSPVDWKSIPTHADEFEEFFYSLFEASSSQSIYQKELPPALQEHELLQRWLKNPAIPRILERLAKSEPVKIDSAVAGSLGFKA